MVPLGLAGSVQIAAFEKTLGSLKNSETGNLAAGFERALDEVSDRSSAQPCGVRKGSYRCSECRKTIELLAVESRSCCCQALQRREFQ